MRPNTDYLILGLIIESITKHSVADEIRTRLLLPFELTQTSYPSTQAMPDPWARGFGLNASNQWEDVSGTIPVSLMGSAGEMISDMADMRRWTQLRVMGKTNGSATQRARLDCIPTGQETSPLGSVQAAALGGMDIPADFRDTTLPTTIFPRRTSRSSRG